MLATKSKPLEEILAGLKNDKKVFIIGCGECATSCHTGGEADVKRMKEELEKAGKVITGTAVPNAPCVASQVKLLDLKSKDAISAADSILVMACGSGTQSVQAFSRFGKRVHSANDSIFSAVLDKTGIACFEWCSSCGECILEETGGICPITRCPKGMMNGPCGGMNKGKCEVDKERDCAWVLIYNNMKELKQLEEFKAVKLPKDWSKAVKPRQHTIA
ncbi:MAG: hypothetical protein AUJ75_02485 [Candidatus Omnitrophica bacterium CG1_02_49_10]|nr:MAG: hypothetical protein AUJ75_02485 [Candidatus Omnitrophica bacterium CG1_02_49_10]